MSEFVARSVASPALEVRSLSVSYGRVEALHDLSLTLERGVLAVVGRNGMGKSTLCKAIMGLVRPTHGTIRAYGTEITGLSPHKIVRAGVAYVPQGRRVWPSLTVDEHLRLAFLGDKDSSWTPERIYETFPRLAERRKSYGTQLSGGEQQMLAIGRALLANPRLLIMDEPTEGLAPVIVQQVSRMLRGLAEEGAMSILLIEQNLGVALEVSSDIAIMMHGRIAREMSARELAADEALQRRLLGVGRDEDEEELAPVEESVTEVRYIQIAREHGDERQTPSYTFAEGARPAFSATAIPNRWSADNPPLAGAGIVARRGSAAADERTQSPDISAVPISAMFGRNA
jgi:ABC-type branched-subunit amino acid transport system ATPase component